MLVNKVLNFSILDIDSDEDEVYEQSDDDRDGYAASRKCTDEDNGGVSSNALDHYEMPDEMHDDVAPAVALTQILQGTLSLVNVIERKINVISLCDIETIKNIE
jgi:hypothetical protein